MIIITIILFILVSLISLQNIKNGKDKLSLYSLLSIILILIAGLRSEDSFSDYSTYIEIYNELIAKSDFLIEISFVAITKFVHLVFGNVLFLFLIYAIIGVSTKLIAIKQLTQLWFLSLVIYISYFFILHEMTQIRCGVAAGFLLLTIKPIYERNFKRFSIFAILAVLFHYSAIIILPLWLLGTKPRRLFLFLSVPLGFLVYFSGINLISTIPIPYIQAKMDIYNKLQEMGIAGFDQINVFNYVFLAKVAIYYTLLWKYDILLAKNAYTPILMKIYAVSLMIFPMFAVIPVLAFRVSELYGITEIILIPMIYYTIKPKFMGKLLVIFIGLVVLLISIFYNKLII